MPSPHLHTLINRLYSFSLENTSPFFLMNLKYPYYKFLKAFGCVFFPHLRPYNSNKLAMHSNECIFLGYSPSHKGINVLTLVAWFSFLRMSCSMRIDFPFLHVSCLTTTSNSVSNKLSPSSTISFSIRYISNVIPTSPHNFTILATNSLPMKNLDPSSNSHGSTTNISNISYSITNSLATHNPCT